MKNQKGQIGIVLTLIAMGLMTVGIGIGTWAVKNPSSPFYTKAGENKPDLQITEIVIPTNIQEGDNPKFTITQKNIGNAASVHGNAKVNIYNDKGTEVQLWEQSWPKDTLNPGESTSASITWTSAPAGDHKICAEADYYNKNNELDETNNKLCEDFQVYVSGEPTPTPTAILTPVPGEVTLKSHTSPPWSDGGYDLTATFLKSGGFNKPPSGNAASLQAIISREDRTDRNVTNAGRITASTTPERAITASCRENQYCSSPPNYGFNSRYFLLLQFFDDANKGQSCYFGQGGFKKCVEGEAHDPYQYTGGWNYAFWENGFKFAIANAPTATPAPTCWADGIVCFGSAGSAINQCSKCCNGSHPVGSTYQCGPAPTATPTPTLSPSCQTLLNKMQASSGKQCGDSSYDKYADINNDRVVNAVDLSLLSANLSESWCAGQLADNSDPCSQTPTPTATPTPTITTTPGPAATGTPTATPTVTSTPVPGQPTPTPTITPTPASCISITANVIPDEYPDDFDNPQYKRVYKIMAKVCNVFHEGINQTSSRIFVDDQYAKYFDLYEGSWGLPNPIAKGECRSVPLKFVMSNDFDGTTEVKAKFWAAARVTCGPIDIPQSCHGCEADVYQTISFGGYSGQITPTPTTTPVCPFYALGKIQYEDGSKIPAADADDFSVSWSDPPGGTAGFNNDGEVLFDITNLAVNKKSENASITLNAPLGSKWQPVETFCTATCIDGGTACGSHCPSTTRDTVNPFGSSSDGFKVDCKAHYVYGWKLNYTGPTFTPTPPVTATPTVTPAATVTPTEVPGATNTPTPTNTPAPGGNTWQVDARWDGSAQCWYADATCGNIGWSGQPSGNSSCSNCLYCSVNRDGNYIQIENRTGSIKTFQCEWHDCNGCTTQCTYRSPPCDSNTAECRENTPTSETITLPNGGIVQCKLKGGTATPAPTAPPGATNTPKPATPTPISCPYTNNKCNNECPSTCTNSDCPTNRYRCPTTTPTATPTPTVTPTITLMPVPGEVILTDHKKPVWQDSGYEFKATFSKSNKFNKDNNMIIGGVRFQAIISNSKGGTPLLCRGSYYTIEDEVSSIDVEFNCYSWDDCSNSEKGYGKDSRYFLLLVYRDDAKNYQNCYFGKNFKKCIEGEFHNPVEYFSGFGANEWNKGFEFQSPSLFIPATAVDQACEANGVVNARDYSIIIVNYGKKSGKGDVNDDGVVNGKDLSLVLKYLGKRVLQTTPAQILTPKVTQPRY